MKIKDIPLNILGAVRQNLGAENENDTSFDSQIENLELIEIIGKYSAWHLGDSGWGRDFIRIYEELKRIDAINTSDEEVKD